MSVRFVCPTCQLVRIVPDRLLGHRIRCPECDAVVEVPLLADTGDSEDGPEVDEGLELVVLESVVPEAAVFAAAESQDAAHVRTGTVAPLPQVELAPLPSARALAEPMSVGEAAAAGGDSPPSASDDDDGDFGANRERIESEMDMTPMVDVTFLLLIFFMVTASFSLQKAMMVPKPTDDAPSTQHVQTEDDTESVTVEIDEFNTFHVIAPDAEFEAPSRQELLVRLRESRDRGSGATVSKLIVRAHEEALHARVVTALDAGAIAGFPQVQLSTTSGE